jgi:DNA-binding transcriptional regulator YdaS (Cro superfamily)
MAHFREHVRRAVEIAGSQEKLAAAAGFSQQHISYLLNEAKQISAESAVGIERATAGQVPRHLMRPDMFPPPAGAERSKERASA